eukprot:SAG31_NODE_1054_length_10140_cov_4.264316_18_plen_149_part_00
MSGQMSCNPNKSSAENARAYSHGSLSQTSHRDSILIVCLRGWARSVTLLKLHKVLTLLGTSKHPKDCPAAIHSQRTLEIAPCSTRSAFRTYTHRWVAPQHSEASRLYSWPRQLPTRPSQAFLDAGQLQNCCFRTRVFLAKMELSSSQK